MADRFPLIVDSSSQQIKELPDGDNLLLGDGERLKIGDDNDLNIKWPKLNVSPIWSKKDKEAKKILEIKDCDLF